MPEILQQDTENLKKIIDIALNKLNLEKPIYLCRFIPNKTNTGHMHHFSFEKIIKDAPQEARLLIEKYIVAANSPKTINPKPRFPKTKKNFQGFSNISDSFVQSILIKAIESNDRSLQEEIYSRKHFYIQDLKNRIIAAMKAQDALDINCVKIYNELINL